MELAGICGNILQRVHPPSLLEGMPPLNLQIQIILQIFGWQKKVSAEWASQSTHHKATNKKQSLFDHFPWTDSIALFSSNQPLPSQSLVDKKNMQVMKLAGICGNILQRIPASSTAWRGDALEFTDSNHPPNLWLIKKVLAEQASQSTHQEATN